MSVTREQLLEYLPPFQDRWLMIHQDQSVSDIIAEVLQAHREFAPYYDKIALFFIDGSTKQICENLYTFCKNNLRYVEESEDDQTTSIPQGILTRGQCDCKGYAGFIGGILDAITRAGKKISWRYRFASYKLFDDTPGHVFIVVSDKGNDIWIDPTPRAENVSPYWYKDKKINVSTMALRRNIAGIENLDFEAIEIPIMETDSDDTVPAQVKADIKLLLDYDVINDRAQFNDEILKQLLQSVSGEVYAEIFDAYHRLKTGVAKISGVFDYIWRGVKQEIFFLPRQAFLSLVGLNIFGLATKIYNALSNKDGLPDPNDHELYALWHDKFAGDWTSLINTVHHGKDKKAILGAAIGQEPVTTTATAAWIATASAIIAAFKPLLDALLKARPQVIPDNTPPIPMINSQGGTGFNPIDWIKHNPILALGIGAGVFYFAKKKKLFR